MKYEERPHTPGSATQWIHDHWSRVDRLIKSRFRRESEEEVLTTIFEQPIQSMIWIKSNFNLTNEERYKKAIQEIIMGSKIIVLFGKRGSGKTCFSHKLLKDALTKTNRRIVYVSGSSNIDKEFDHERTFRTTKKGDIIVVDEAAMALFSRQSGAKENVEMNKKLFRLRHAGKTVIFITQNTNSLDLGIIRLADLLIFKPFSFMQAVTERDFIINPLMKLLIPTMQEETLIWGEDIGMHVTTTPHKDWNDDLSEAWRPIEEEEKAILLINDLLREGIELEDIKNELEGYDWYKPLKWYQEREKVYSEPTNI